MRKVKPFTDTLREIRGGDLLDELSVLLNEAVEAAVDTDKPATVTLNLKLKPKAGAVIVEAMATNKLPKDPYESMFYATPENNLSLRAQNQVDIEDVRIVPNDEAPARAVGDDIE